MCNDGFTRIKNYTCVEEIINCMTHSDIDGTCSVCNSGFILLDNNACSPAVDGCATHNLIDGTCVSCNDKTATPAADGKKCIKLS